MTWLLGFMSPRLWIAIIVLALMAGSHFAVYRAGRAAVRTEMTSATLKATQAARVREAQWQSDAQTITEVHDDELRRIASQHVRDLGGLRNRAANRLPPAAACTANDTGATGAQLSRADATFLVGQAADADRTASDLRACQAWAETVTKGAS